MRSLIAFFPLLVLVAGCSKETPKKEDTPELITRATLTFAPVGSGLNVVVSATDPDGEGVQNIAADGPINLTAGTTYVLTIQLINGLVSPGAAGYDLSQEVAEEGHEHQFFFSWSDPTVFSNPTGNGNIDSAADPVNYTGGPHSKDANGRPLGLSTTWTTKGSGPSTGSFRLVLKHQPNLKSDTSDATVGETDLDLTFTLNLP